METIGCFPDLRASSLNALLFSVGTAIRIQPKSIFRERLLLWLRHFPLQLARVVRRRANRLVRV